MFKHIMIPIDLAEKDKWHHAIEVCADLARHYNANVTLVSVSGGLQGKVSHSHEEYGRQLALFAGEIAQEQKIEVSCLNYGVPDPSVEVDQKLIEAIDELQADLVVMASHQPGWVEHLVNSHAGRLARHAPISVFVVRSPTEA